MCRLNKVQRRHNASRRKQLQFRISAKRSMSNPIRSNYGIFQPITDLHTNTTLFDPYSHHDLLFLFCSYFSATQFAFRGLSWRFSLASFLANTAKKQLGTSPHCCLHFCTSNMNVNITFIFTSLSSSSLSSLSSFFTLRYTSATATFVSWVTSVDIRVERWERFDTFRFRER